MRPGRSRWRYNRRMLRATLPILACLAVAVVGLSFVDEPMGGTEVCLGCREERVLEERVFALRTVQRATNDCSRWVAAELPGHAHRWRRIGCWSDGRKETCLPLPLQLHTPAEEWLAFLRELPGPARAPALGAMADDGLVVTMTRRLDAWRARR